MYTRNYIRCSLLTVATQPKIKELQVQLQGFLDADGPKFCKDLWNLMLSAQESPLGVPAAMLEAKKLELLQEKEKVCVPRSACCFAY